MAFAKPPIPMEQDSLPAVSRFRDEMSRVDEVAHVLLKGHLLIEEALTRVLEQHLFHAEHLTHARLQFTQKVALARSLCLRKSNVGEWELIQAINSLRNDLAHRLSSSDRGKKLVSVKTIYFREASEYERTADLRNESDAVILMNACAHCAGFLDAFEQDARSLRKFIYNLDRGMNPNEPPFQL